MTISRKYWFATLLVLAAAAAILTFMGRVPICTCGTIKLWHGVVNSAENSQHLSDWYSFSHIIHGFLFFAALKWLLPRVHLGWRLVIATGVEASWEILENTPMVIDRYREATMAFGYSGDSVLNSMSDCAMMIIGFLFAARVRARIWIPIAIAFELFTLWRIRDNLTLNVLMLVYPVESIRDWQGGA
ncbi:MAG: DUF2585 domain-containing protein [Pseudomonadota bacterium]